MRKTLQNQNRALIDAVCKRLANGALKVLKTADARQLAEVLEAPSDSEVMLRILRLPETLTAIQSDDPLAAARVRGVEARKRLMEAEGGSLSSEQMAEVLRLSRQAIDKRRKTNRLIGLDAGRHGYIYPAWQVTKSGMLNGLEEVLEELKHHDPWMQAQFILQPNSRLGERTPLEVLREGDVAGVRAAARALGEHGAA
jgi:biotin operon repressor